MVVVLLIDYRRLERWAPALYVAALLLTASTLVLAPVTRGNRSWLVYGPLSLQPAEFAKIGLVLMMARWFHRNPPGRLQPPARPVRPGLILAGPVGLILLQHDLGVAVLTLLIGATYLLFVRIPSRAWAVVGAAALAALAGLWSFVFKDYQRKRILDFLDPVARPARLRLPGHPVAHRGRLGRASPARATSRARRRSSSSCPRSTPTSPSRCSPRSGASSAAACC